ncbi:single-stranded-DNA-specific exonuclease RecJ [Synechococcus sp. PCC 7502]|uniref:single-stranded-DNA-specific exonuclease RecJ n=1 Tax=Synechococcus sp. PCC 7502 TaxID=1173263 RepID=UPI00029FB63F|nr:single-stranded-DNA-specific exonuclease RecJ [Synechococcus sp. PCC 7502]AFY73207.1 single-stranded-DNA-specific exonuclease RecJ [Synechococcus sp. PCC 7502]
MTLPLQRWQIAAPQPELASEISNSTGLSPLLAQVLINRDMNTPERSQVFLDPDREVLVDPKLEFPDLVASLDILEAAVKNHQKVAICGDYDADGMTSTALLLRTLRLLEVEVSYEIPSRMNEGYGINIRMVEELQARGVGLIITVDNGISAFAAIARARELNLAVIITDHHDLPEQLPPANAILNPKLINLSSPYYAIAGVGVAYVLALELADRFGKRQALESLLLELFTLGTIADLAHLTGINRRLVKQGLRLLGRSQLPGVTALIQASGIADDQKIGLKPEAIGFSLGPRINAVGRIGDPVTVIELLTADDMGIAITLAQKCEETNRTRQELCSQIEREAIAYIQSLNLDLSQERVLVVVQPNWHHGVIGIVASRLVERYGVPVFIGTYEEEQDHLAIRGSVRSIPEFNVFESLEFCREFLNKYGGHPAAGGFSMPSQNLQKFSDRLREFAHQHLEPHHLKPLIQVDVKADLHDISLTLLEQIDLLHPCGMGNSDPVFYTPNVRVISQQIRGKNKACLALELDRGNGSKIKAISWRWGEYYPIPDYVDLAYKLRANKWQDKTSVELELVGIRTPWTPILESKPAPKIAIAPKWQNLKALAEIPQPALIYGYDHPEFTGDSDRPIPHKTYKSLVLWSLPPSITHLRWLIALTKPALIYLGSQIPVLPTQSELKQKLSLYIGSGTESANLQVNLLDLGQKLWLAPCVIVSTWRELGYDCANFPPTQPLSTELENQKRWYQISIEKITSIITK